MTTTNTALQFDSSDSAKLKLYVIKLLEKTNWKTVSLAFPGVSKANDIKTFDEKLKDWMIYYNSICPHQSLEYMTPEKYVVQLQKGVA